ncbi:MAG: amino acid permease [bacterium]|nr:amino acid permease [bacterium]
MGSEDNKNTGILTRQLGLFDSSMMLIGIVIGSGIFLTTGIMAEALPSAGLIMLAWFVGGILTLAGALTYAELGAAMPEAGGHYVYLREAFGPLPGFLFGWIMFLISMTGSIAALGVAFAEYFGYFFPALSIQDILFSTDLSVFGYAFQYNLSSGQIVAMVVIILLSAFNYIGVGPGKIIQNIITVIKIGTLIVIIIMGITIGKTVAIDFSLNPTGMTFSGMLTGFGIALVAISWAFDGWNNLNYAAGEIKDPGRNIPLSLIVGTLVISVLYMLINYVYFLAMPVNEMAGVVRIAEKATTALHGSTTAGLISAAILISVLGALNGAIFVGPRVYYAMAKDNLFFSKVAEVHPKYKTPGFSIFIQALWSCLLTITGTFDQLITFVMVITILFWTAATAGVFTLRKKRPDMPRPYKTWGYPWVPAVFIIASTGILINALINRPVESFAGLLITLIGVPVYYYWKRKDK